MPLISEALNLKSKEMVVVVGGGGKTTIINRLAKEIHTLGKKVAVITTTKIYLPRNINPSKILCTKEIINFEDRIIKLAGLKKILFIGKEVNSNNKIVGLSKQEVNRIMAMELFDVILVEGDGTKERLFKAPRSYEPVIPELATVVVPVIGVDCIGKKLVEEYFFCIDQIKSLTNLKYGDQVMEKDIATILLHDNGYKKNIPNFVRWIPFINKVESREREIFALKLAGYLKKAGVEKIIIGAAQKNDPVSKVIS